MVTTSTPSPSPDRSLGTNGQSGFLDQLVKSIFEPGANKAAVLAMNVSFFCLLLVLFALAFLTSWNKHVLVLFGVTTLLWGSMVWFVMEITKLQNRPDNMPVLDDGKLDPKSAQNVQSIPEESKKER